ncbi:uncharacterized protein LOC119501875 [Sebastes umbrosus]|uniref:uncharacterized protein LOC119501875 n=1 Tax=Sebastes umbrosus TaxID=72105 RepID=UPI0018A0D6E6|nr:uncharacterized protein LOC119501875 [Sebastes umbrosus]
MASSDSELMQITAELNQLSLTKQQLLEKNKFKSIFQELRSRIEFRQTEEEDLSQPEINSIDDKLKQLAERKAELEQSYENMLNAKDEKNTEKVEAKDSSTSYQKSEPAVPVTKIFYVEAPPDFPAPAVILDVENFPVLPCRTQCPECQQFVVTETYTAVSSVTWLVCCMTALAGCVVGCCLVPFCFDRFKSTIHRCPKCRTKITTVKKL